MRFALACPQLDDERQSYSAAQVASLELNGRRLTVWR
jgi:hypothetical protein